jgi:hypothetical protein
MLYYRHSDTPCAVIDDYIHPLTLYNTVAVVTLNISTVVMLGFLLCQFNAGILACALFVSSVSKFFLWLLQFNTCSLGYGW